MVHLSAQPCVRTTTGIARDQSIIGHGQCPDRENDTDDHCADEGCNGSQHRGATNHSAIVLDPGPLRAAHRCSGIDAFDGRLATELNGGPHLSPLAPALVRGYEDRSCGKQQQNNSDAKLSSWWNRVGHRSQCARPMAERQIGVALTSTRSAG